MTNLTHNSFILYVYFSPLHVSSKHVLIIRRSVVLIQHMIQSLSVTLCPVCRSSRKCSTCIPEGHLQRVIIPNAVLIEDDTKKRELSKNPTKIEEIQEKEILTEIEPIELAF